MSIIAACFKWILEDQKRYENLTVDEKLVDELLKIESGKPRWILKQRLKSQTSKMKNELEDRKLAIKDLENEQKKEIKLFKTKFNKKLKICSNVVSNYELANMTKDNDNCISDHVQDLLQKFFKLK